MKRLKTCNYALLATTLPVLASSVILEASHGNPVFHLPFNFWACLHIIAATIMSGLVTWHLKLNWGKVMEWKRRFSFQASKASKVLSMLIAATSLTGLISIPQWLLHGHSIIGGVHGKIGFLFIIIAISHTFRHRKWFKKSGRRKGKMCNKTAAK